ncbi:DMT family transporter [Lacticaseibacillus zeae]|uniref:EamA family transporter n=1 Tax=Lacticaseibacillus zeae subsp. silagei TaxID=3068307 RepID=A0ABD7Z7R6_LACZE|nr:MULTISPECIES: EamA family transporter [Lacticaseibacillus]MDE3315884.1 DMT family transporter [Lacticaseibacillus zeae]OFR93785.1 peptide ABC transporter permease [Lactobacillus sp. HMSC068F07]WLV82931.1 EamA family transporter [Lacticaseibacillus sp. NCIMB 15475]WLV85679.1 EamA family transporter [Lacticaseibacillus sp. NCIMB 15474]
MKRIRLWGIFLAIMGSSFWGISGPVSESLFDKGIKVSWLISSKMLIAGGVLMAVAFWKDRSAIMAPWRNRRDALQLIIFVLFGMIGMQYIYFKAVAVANAATATILQYLSPVVVLVFLALRLREKPRRIDLLTIGMAMLGTALVVTKGRLTHLAISPSAFFWGIMAALAAAAYTLLPAGLLKRHSPIVVTAWAQLLGGFLVDAFDPFWKQIPHLDAAGWAGYWFIVIFGTIIAYSVYLASLQFISPTAATLLDAFEPLGATLVSVAFLHMHLGFAEVLGGVLIILTVAMMAIVTPRGPKLEKRPDE